MQDGEMLGQTKVQNEMQACPAYGVSDAQMTSRKFQQNACTPLTQQAKLRHTNQQNITNAPRETMLNPVIPIHQVKNHLPGAEDKIIKQRAQ